jgi:hypothetical protein
VFKGLKRAPCGKLEVNKQGPGSQTTPWQASAELGRPRRARFRPHAATVSLGWRLVTLSTVGLPYMPIWS